MKNLHLKTPVELWEHLESVSRDNSTVRNALMAKRANDMTPEHTALYLAAILLEQNSELMAHTLAFYRDSPVVHAPNP